VRSYYKGVPLRQYLNLRGNAISGERECISAGNQIMVLEVCALKVNNGK